jgi:hypothetical protein
MLEEAIKAQYTTDNNPDKDGVFQLTTLTSLPLKSPKRLIALQLANNNPAFRERFRQKLEQSGGPLAMGKVGQNAALSLSQALPFSAPTHWNSSSQYSVGSNNSENNDSNDYSFEGELEKLINTPDWMRSHDTVFNTSLNSRSFLNSDANAGISSFDPSQRSAKKDGRGRKSKQSEISQEETEDFVRPLKLRQKRRKDIDSDQNPEIFSAEASSRMANFNESSLSGNQNDSSIIKRRRKGELQIMVDAGNGTNTTNTAGPLTNAIRANNLHSLMGGGIGDMGPPNDTPRRSARLKNGPLSTLSNIGTLNYLDSPFLEKTLLFSDGFGPFGVDTPSKLMHLDPPLSKGDGVRFDFDEAVAAHFPSPRAGEHIKGSSPYRWSGSSIGSGVSGFFNFPDSTLSQQPRSSFGSQPHVGTTDSHSNQPVSALNDNETQQSIYAKKFKKALKPSKESSEDIKPLAENSTKNDDLLFQSPSQIPPSQNRPRANSKVKKSPFSLFMFIFYSFQTSTRKTGDGEDGKDKKKSIMIDFDEEHTNELLDSLPLDVKHCSFIILHSFLL